MKRIIVAMAAPATMPPLALRRLTGPEQALARGIFGPSLETGRVRVFAAPWWPRAFVPNGSLVVWPAATARLDFTAAPPGATATLVHELTHVWQAQNGVNLLFAKLKAGDSAAAYAYDLDRGPAFAGLNIEQQAMVVEHAFLARHGAPTPFPAAAYRAFLADFGRG